MMRQMTAVKTYTFISVYCMSSLRHQPGLSGKKDLYE